MELKLTRENIRRLDEPAEMSKKTGISKPTILACIGEKTLESVMIEKVKIIALTYGKDFTINENEVNHLPENCWEWSGDGLYEAIKAYPLRFVANRRTHQELAELAGIQRSALSNILSNQTLSVVRVARALSAALDVTWIIKGVK